MTSAFMELAEKRQRKPIAQKEKMHIHEELAQLLGNHEQPAEFYACCLEINEQLGRLVREAWKRETTPMDSALLRGNLAREGYKAFSPALSTEQYARKSGISRQAVLKRLKAGTLLAWRENSQNAYRLPVWQFDADGNLLPGMPAILKILNIPEFDEWTKILFFLQRRNSLKGKRPIELLEHGKIEAVTALAQDYVR